MTPEYISIDARQKQQRAKRVSLATQLDLLRREVTNLRAQHEELKARVSDLEKMHCGDDK